MTDSLFPDGRSPRELGYTFPAEWSRQSCVYLSWPVNPETWTGCFDSMESAYSDFAAEISHHELLRIVVRSVHNERIAALLADHGALLECPASVPASSTCPESVLFPLKRSR